MKRLSSLKYAMSEKSPVSRYTCDGADTIKPRPSLREIRAMVAKLVKGNRGNGYYEGPNLTRRPSADEVKPKEVTATSCTTADLWIPLVIGFLF